MNHSLALKPIIVALFLSALILTGTSCSDTTSKETWLHGTWEHVYDPNDDFEEWMDFAPDGGIELSDNEGVYFKGKYWVVGNEIQVPYKKNGESNTMVWNISSDKKTLSNPGGAAYQKTD